MNRRSILGFALISFIAQSTVAPSAQARDWQNAVQKGVGVFNRIRNTAASMRNQDYGTDSSPAYQGHSVQHDVSSPHASQGSYYNVDRETMAIPSRHTPPPSEPAQPEYTPPQVNYQPTYHPPTGTTTRHAFSTGMHADPEPDLRREAAAQYPRYSPPKTNVRTRKPALHLTPVAHVSDETAKPSAKPNHENDVLVETPIARAIDTTWVAPIVDRMLKSMQ